MIRSIQMFTLLDAGDVVEKVSMNELKLCLFEVFRKLTEKT
jgi:hypothetical protein